MVDYIREIVSGKKRRYKKDGFNLDLTYITDRIIAMSFPGSGFESMYRNDIGDVAKLLNSKHGSNYVLMNLSGRKYDYDKFDRKVVDFPFEDHHSPPLELLFRASRFMHDYLKENPNNVVIVHCLAGKGRTGTVICCFFLYTRRFENADEALLYYKRRRFESGGGVTQPSQIRYVKYFAETLFGYIYQNIVLKPTIIKLERMIIYGLPRISSNYFRPYVEVYSVKDNYLLYSTKRMDKAPQKFPIGEQMDNIPVSIIFNPNECPMMTGDLLVKVYHLGSWDSKLAFRFGVGTSFFKSETNKIVLDFPINALDPDSTKDDDRFPFNFKVQLIAEFKQLQPGVNTPEQRSVTACANRDQVLWDSIYKLLGEYDPEIKNNASSLLFKSPENDNVDDVLASGKFYANIEQVGSPNGCGEPDDEMNSSFTDNGPINDGRPGSKSYKKEVDKKPEQTEIVAKTL